MAKVLVVEDEEGVRSFLVEALELFGHEVSSAEDGAAGALRIQAEAFDVMFTDIKMPNIDGMTLLRMARDKQPEMQVIVVTAHGTVETAVEAMKLGAFDYLQKPVSGLDELRLLTERAVQHRRLCDLHDSVSLDDDTVTLTWGDPAMVPVVDALQKVARTNATVLLLGESGTGKEVAARALHKWSARAAGPVISVNCAALSENLLESELFGHEKGAFTGATARRRGRIELAAGGTFFLDEVGELKLDLQAKLLRVLETRRFERIGGSVTLDAEVRWVAATNRDLLSMVAAGTFRDDLYHRLAVFPIRLPPLRDRRTDILPLATTLLQSIAAELGRPGLTLHADAQSFIEEHSWPGNIRELRNALERAAILADGEVLQHVHFELAALAGGHVAPIQADAPVTLGDIEKQAIEAALAAFGGNRRRAAERLGIAERTLYDKLKRYGLS